MIRFLQELFRRYRGKTNYRLQRPQNDKHLFKRSGQNKPLAGFVNNKDMYDRSKNCYDIFYCPNGVDEDLFIRGMKTSNNLIACWVGNSKHFTDNGGKASDPDHS